MLRLVWGLVCRCVAISMVAMSFRAGKGKTVVAALQPWQNVWPSSSCFSPLVPLEHRLFGSPFASFRSAKNGGRCHGLPATLSATLIQTTHVHFYERLDGRAIGLLRRMWRYLILTALSAFCSRLSAPAPSLSVYSFILWMRIASLFGA